MDQPPFLHDLLGQQDNLAVEQYESGQVVPFDQPEFLIQAVLDLGRHGAVAPDGGLAAQLPQVAVRGVALRYGGRGQGVTQIGAEVELAALRDAPGVGDSLGAVLEQPRHRLRRFQAQVVIGLDMPEGLVQRDVAGGRFQVVLQPVALWRVVVNSVAGRERNASFAG